MSCSSLIWDSWGLETHPDLGATGSTIMFALGDLRQATSPLRALVSSSYPACFAELREDEMS